jgi:hypothetical protein
MTRKALVLAFSCAGLLLASAPAPRASRPQGDRVKHLTTSRDFTLKVAEQMPEADYGFKLTPPQMSFGEQMAHLASDQAALLAPFSNAKPSALEAGVDEQEGRDAYVRQSYDQSIALVSKLTPAQIERSYPVSAPR